jgi:putative two-component system response regulator
MRVLVVEDSPTQTLRVRLVLESQGFLVKSVENGKQALEAARRELPDVILSDVLMPGMDGFQLCLELRQDAELGAIPVVLQTASFQSDRDRTFACELGADAYIAKDLSPPVLAGRLFEAVERRKSTPTAAPTLPDERRFRERYGDLLATRLVEEAAALERANEALTAAYDATLEALVGALDLRDTETEHHSWRVAEYSLALAKSMGASREFLVDLERGSLLHDIGKIGVPDQILRKPGPLDDDEWAVMRTHPELGYRMIAHIEFLRGAAPVVLSHHERWEGGGYPSGVSGKRIPLGARIFAVSDTLDAITSNRPYRPARGFDVALEEISRMSGSQFEPAVVGAALAIPAAQWQGMKERVERGRENKDRSFLQEVRAEMPH